MSNDSSTTQTAALPGYADQLKAFHDAFRDELTAIVDGLPIAPGMRVLDMACGDGFYTRLLAERLGAQGLVVGLDSSPTYLRFAPEGRWDYVCGLLERMPFARESFDFIWCAQSLYSLPEPTAALRRLHEMLKPGGMIGVLENDTIHEILLPWDSPLELAVRRAEHAWLTEHHRRPEKFYVGRELSAVLAGAGFEPLSLRSQVIDRQTPLAPAEEYFVASYLQRLAERVQPYLDADVWSELVMLVDERSPRYLLAREHVTFSWMNVLALARRNE